MKKINLIGLFLIIGIIFGGCSNEKDKIISNHASTSSNHVTQSSNKTFSDKSKSNKVEKRSEISQEMTSQTSWNVVKGYELDNFMNDWGPTMNQHYDRIFPFTMTKDGKSAPEFFGVSFQDLMGLNTTLNDKPIKLINYGQYGPAISDKSAYYVVAAYTDINDTKINRSNHGHLYVFTIHDGQPYTLISEQNQAADVQFNFSLTKNADVKNEFIKLSYQKQPDLVNGYDNSKTAKKYSKKLLSLIMFNYLHDNKEEYLVDIKAPVFWAYFDPKIGLLGYSGGSQLSSTDFYVYGDDIYLERQGSSFVWQKIPIKELIKTSYSTNKQKDLMNKYNKILKFTNS